MIVHSAKCCVVWPQWDQTCSRSTRQENSSDLRRRDWITWLARNYLTLRSVWAYVSTFTFKQMIPLGVPDQRQSDDRSKTDGAAAKVTKKGSKKGGKRREWGEKKVQCDLRIQPNSALSHSSVLAARRQKHPDGKSNIWQRADTETSSDRRQRPCWQMTGCFHCICGISAGLYFLQ